MQIPTVRKIDPCTGNILAILANYPADSVRVWDDVVDSYRFPRASRELKFPDVLLVNTENGDVLMAPEKDAIKARIRIPLHV